jgi:hypothetical protein
MLDEVIDRLQEIDHFVSNIPFSLEWIKIETLTDELRARLKSIMEGIETYTELKNNFKVDLNYENTAIKYTEDSSDDEKSMDDENTTEMVCYSPFCMYCDKSNGCMSQYAYYKNEVM